MGTENQPEHVTNHHDIPWYHFKERHDQKKVDEARIYESFKQQNPNGTAAEFAKFRDSQMDNLHARDWKPDPPQPPGPTRYGVPISTYGTNYIPYGYGQGINNETVYETVNVYNNNDPGAGGSNDQQPPSDNQQPPNDNQQPPTPPPPAADPGQNSPPGGDPTPWDFSSGSGSPQLDTSGPGTDTGPSMDSGNNNF